MSNKGSPADLVGRIYDGALDLSAWPQILADVAVAFDAICCDLFVGDLSQDEVFFASLNNRFSFERLKDYHTHYRHIDDRLLITRQKPPERMYADWEIILQDKFVKTEFYNDFYLPHGLR